MTFIPLLSVNYCSRRFPLPELEAMDDLTRLDTLTYP